MTGAGPARSEALEVLRLVRAGRQVNEAIAERSRTVSLSVPDRHLMTQLGYGVLRQRRYLDAWISPLVRGRLDSDVADILRMAFFQLGFLDRVPAYAVVHAAVELTKVAQPRAAGLVNAVLRRGADHPPEEMSLAVRYSHPDWLVERWAGRYGAQLESILAADNEIPPLTLRVNALKTTREAVLAALEDAGIAAQPSEYLAEAIRVTGPLWLESFAPYQRGEVSVQDESGMLVACALSDPGFGGTVLDVAAGLGGKSTHVLECWPGSRVVAVDRSRHRLDGLEQNVRRLGLTDRIAVVHDDSRHFCDEHGEAFDQIVLDAPCSGLGVLRRRVDARWKKTAEEIGLLAGLQQRLLVAAWKALAPGGSLVYSTCSVEPEETSEQMAWAQSELAGSQVESIADQLPSTIAGETSAAGMLFLPPGRFGMDGFFIARLRKAP